MIWIILIVVVCGLLNLDLGVLNPNPHVVHVKEALRWTALWTTIGIGFAGFIYYGYNTGFMGLGDTVGVPQTGGEAALAYFTGYLVELSLSMDNVFAIALIFKAFGIAPRYQHRILFWGILGAIVFRGVMIVIGAALLEQFAWIEYVFGVILLYSAYTMYRSGGEEIDPDENKVVQWLSRVYPISKEHHDEKFFVVANGVRMATPALVALLVVETTDILFAFDSIPAIFAITRDPFIVFSSNIFAILGLRSLYFVLASMMDRFHLLKYALVIILAFVGVKMLVRHWVHIDPLVSLAVIVVVLAGGIVLSLRQNPTTVADVEAAEVRPEDAAIK